MRKILWAVVSVLMGLSMVMAACGPASTLTTPATPPTPTTPVTLPTPATPVTPAAPLEKEAVKPSVEAPKYGGTLTLVQNVDFTRWDTHAMPTPGNSLSLTNQLPWDGDWALGKAGGYGSGKTDWAGYYYIFDLFTGYVAEKITWSTDTARDTGTIVYQIRRGIRYSLDPKSEASRLANGRELTADDVILNFKRAGSTPGFFMYNVNPGLRTANITKTGPLEVTVKVGLGDLITAINWFSGKVQIMPPEVWQRYGGTTAEMGNWRVVAGTGPFMLTDNIPGSVATMIRNQNYWMKDPVGPGKGNQLPYLDTVRVLIIPDASTRQAALRTGKIDLMTAITWEDATQIRKTATGILDVETPLQRGASIAMNNQRAPFTDVRVRRALLLATDLETINKGYYGSLAQINTYPNILNESYADLYLALDDPGFPKSARELYIYNPAKAKQLLAEAGYPNGFKTSVILLNTDVDLYSIIKEMWTKAGIELELKVRESAAKTTLGNAGDYDLNTGTPPSLAQFYTGGGSLDTTNKSYGNVQDTTLSQGYEKVRRATITDFRQGMREMKELTKYIVDQVYNIPLPAVATRVFWWPWVRNYSGEQYPGVSVIWPQFVWYDVALKKSMGH